MKACAEVIGVSVITAVVYIISVSLRERVERRMLGG
jgi:hypothetical protein